MTVYFIIPIKTSMLYLLRYNVHQRILMSCVKKWTKKKHVLVTSGGSQKEEFP